MYKLFLLFLTMVLLGLILSCNPTQSLQAPHYNFVSPAKFEQQLHKDRDSFTLVDVRTGGEYKNGHIEGATNLSLFNPAFKKKIAQFNRKLPILIYCQTGHRSMYAAKWLDELGFEKIFELNGGFKVWNDSAYATVRTDKKQNGKGK